MTHEPVILVVLLLVLAWRERAGRHTYRLFKETEDTAVRQMYLRRWLVESVLLYGVASLAILEWPKRRNAILEMPPEFATLRSFAGAEGVSSMLDGLLIGGAVAAFGVAVIAGWAISKRSTSDSPKTVRAVGDIQPLMPRNRAEKAWIFATAVNAGVSEELMFRLVLPILLVAVTGSPLWSFALAAVVFGLAHAYQGVSGVVATFVFGVVMTLLYLASGALWLAMVVHAAINLNSLLVLPALRRSTSNN